MELFILTILAASLSFTRTSSFKVLRSGALSGQRILQTEEDPLKDKPLLPISSLRRPSVLSLRRADGTPRSNSSFNKKQISAFMSHQGNKPVTKVLKRSHSLSSINSFECNIAHLLEYSPEEIFLKRLREVHPRANLVVKNDSLDVDLVQLYEKVKTDQPPAFHAVYNSLYYLSEHGPNLIDANPLPAVSNEELTAFINFVLGKKLAAKVTVHPNSSLPILHLERLDLGAQQKFYRFPQIIWPKSLITRLWERICLIFNPQSSLTVTDVVTLINQIEDFLQRELKQPRPSKQIS